LREAELDRSRSCDLLLLVIFGLTHGLDVRFGFCIFTFFHSRSSSKERIVDLKIDAMALLLLLMDGNLERRSCTCEVLQFAGLTPGTQGCKASISPGENCPSLATI
jgi:hypothetical protein